MLLPESINSQNLVKRIVYYSSYDDYSGWWKWRWLLWLLLLIPIFLTIFLIARRGRQNKVAYNNPPDPQANEAYYNNNQYQGGYNNDLPQQATPGYGNTNYPETCSQDIIFNNNWEIIILVKFPDRKVHPRHIQNLIRHFLRNFDTVFVFYFI